MRSTIKDTYQEESARYPDTIENNMVHNKPGVRLNIYIRL